ncbi:TOBE domain-containing protein [Streptomyces sp. NPDC007991]|uniref:TOBE domain-containing protein n=1 Tax=Streptomyces sp. NPDC007991 TaxID=3364803 RepID=UPI0036E851A4
MSLSIRHQLPGTVTAVTPGEAMATVGVRLTGGQALTAAITREAADDLGLAPGTAVRAQLLWGSEAVVVVCNSGLCSSAARGRTLASATAVVLSLVGVSLMATE